VEMAGFLRTVPLWPLLAAAASSGTTMAPTLPRLKADATFWVFSDMHVDPIYNVSHCVAGDAASFGRYYCDPPMRLYTSMLKKAKAIDPAPDFVFLGGDFPAHHLPVRQT
jgi:hypothetical protein